MVGVLASSCGITPTASSLEDLQWSELTRVEDVNLVEYQGDLTGDGIGDVLVRDPEGVHVLPGRSDGTIGDRGASIVGTEWFAYPTSWGGDINGDGFSDLVIRAPHDGVLSIFLGPLSGEKDVHSADITVRGSVPNFIGEDGWIGDLDRDGDIDLVVSAPGEPEEACTLEPDGTLIFYGPLIGDYHVTDAATVIAQRGPSCVGMFVSVADVNVDGELDIVSAPGSGRAHVFLGPVPGGQLTEHDAAITIGGEVTRNVWAGTSGDVIVNSSHAVDELAFLWNNSNDRYVARLASPLTLRAYGDADIDRLWLADVDGYRRSLYLGDVTGDHKPDVTVVSTVGVWVVSERPTDVNNRLSQVAYTQPMASWHYSIGDVTGDGLPEVLTYIADTAIVYQAEPVR